MSAFRPLDGVRIVEFSSSIAGPLSTMILAQLGADVVKVESPEGDDARGWPPHIGDRSVVYRNMSVGKRGVVVDLKHPAGVEVALTLARSAAVVLQSMRPGVADRLGIGADAVRAGNPDVIYYDMNAFGTGPVGKSMPGYDPMAQAYTGIMEMTGHDGSPPTRCAPSLIDLGTGMWIAMGILAAVLARHRGQEVRSMETALVDTAFSVVCYQATTALITGERPPRAGSGNPIAAPYQCYQASDAPFMLAAGNQKIWLRVVEVLGAPELATDSRFTTGTLRSANRRVLEQELNARFAQAAADHWVTRFSKASIPATRIYGLEQAVVSDIARERRTFAESEGVPLVRLPWLVDGEALPWSAPAPVMGQHTREVLRETGFSEERIEALVASGAVREAA
ncbi:MAG: CoA transferase [Burkholderiales bacterium]|nr:CoA transferase [Burkholderiales bacterium]